MHRQSKIAGIYPIQGVGIRTSGFQILRAHPGASAPFQNLIVGTTIYCIHVLIVCVAGQGILRMGMGRDEGQVQNPACNVPGIVLVGRESEVCCRMSLKRIRIPCCLGGRTSSAVVCGSESNQKSKQHQCNSSPTSHKAPPFEDKLHPVNMGPKEMVIR